MITPKIKALFQFIEYLHSNIENFNQFNNLIKELELLDRERQKVSPKKNFKDKLKYDEVQADIDNKLKVINENIITPIRNKATVLNICDLNKTESLRNRNISEIIDLKENFSNKDLPEIFKHKSQYIEYRTNTHSTFLSLRFFFGKLDEITKSLFDYFKETEQNEFEAFETKIIQVNSIQETIGQNKQGNKKFSLPIDFLNPSKVQQQNNIKALPPQETETKAEQEQEQQTENDFTLSTIEDWLFEFKEKMNEADYQSLVSALTTYFDTGTFPKLLKPIQINGRPNKKLFGWALNRIFEAKGKGIKKELLLFAKQNISLFTDVEFDENNILKSNLYKYFTTQTR